MSSLPPDLVDALANARGRLPESVELRHFAEVDSTNDIALKLAAAGAPEGTVVLADAQHAGRGRRGRVWFSPPGAGLYVSCLTGGLRPAGPPFAVARAPRPARGALSVPKGGGPEPRSAPAAHSRSSFAPLLTLGAGVAAARAVSAVTGLPVELKWPNDLVIGRPWRKLGGILCESVSVGSNIDAIVVGVGINLRAAAYPSELARIATSIEVELGRPADRAVLAVECVVRLFAVVDRLRNGEVNAVLDEWRTLGRAGLENLPVRWHDLNGERHGRARDLAADGALIVDADGISTRIVSGEVTWDTPT